MGDYLQSLMSQMEEKYGPPPDSWIFGQDIDWTSPLVETTLAVELPFWLMIPDCSVTITWDKTHFEVSIQQLTMELFLDFISDSRQTVAGHTAIKQELFEFPDRLAALSSKQRRPMMPRPCKTVLGIKTRAHRDIFRELTETDRPVVTSEFNAYRASLCEAHIPVINELIQRYRLKTYDYFPYEVSAWDVPVWYVSHGKHQHRALLMGYKGWDFRPVIVGPSMSADGSPNLAQFEWTDKVELEASSSTHSSQGEFDLLDARSLMERGDYTGAVRRAVTSIEALVGQKLRDALQLTMSAQEAEKEFKRNERHFPSRLKQLQKVLNVTYPDALLKAFEETRRIRHEIVHQGRRLTIHDRDFAQRAVDSGRWLFNKIEDNSAMTQAREHGTLRSAGRVALEFRFPFDLKDDGIVIGPLIATP